jgi:hypothetical protein
MDIESRMDTHNTATTSQNARSIDSDLGHNSSSGRRTGLVFLNDGTALRTGPSPRSTSRSKARPAKNLENVYPPSFPLLCAERSPHLAPPQSTQSGYGQDPRAGLPFASVWHSSGCHNFLSLSDEMGAEISFLAMLQLSFSTSTLQSQSAASKEALHIPQSPPAVMPPDSRTARQLCPCNPALDIAPARVSPSHRACNLFSFVALPSPQQAPPPLPEPLPSQAGSTVHQPPAWHPSPLVLGWHQQTPAGDPAHPSPQETLVAQTSPPPSSPQS